MKELVHRVQGDLEELAPAERADITSAISAVGRTQLRQRLSEHLGEQVWRESGLGALDDVDRLHRRVTELEQQTAEQRRQLSESDDELDATRATNRELMTRLNRPRSDGGNH